MAGNPFAWVLDLNGKQLGLAALMYAQDYDEVLPTPDNINTKLEPYLKNSALFEGFSYTFGGGPLSGGTTPTTLYDSGQGVSNPGGLAIDPDPAAAPPARLDIGGSDSFAVGGWARRALDWIGSLFSRPGPAPWLCGSS